MKDDISRHTTDERMPQLDSLRAIAVALVAFNHWVSAKYHFNLPWGSFGVTLFFVLSGFLITGILLKARQHARGSDPLFVIRSFILRRALRIFPIFYLTIILATIAKVDPFPATWAWHAAYLSNVYFFITQSWGGSASHLWSLAVEEQFYVIWPWLMLFAAYNQLFTVALAIWMASTFFRIGIVIAYSDVHNVTLLPFAAFDALAAGSVLAILAKDNDTLRRVLVKYSAILGGALLTITALAANTEFNTPVVRFVMHFGAILVSVALIARASQGVSGVGGWILSNRLLISIGTVSYGIYLYHNIAPIYLLDALREYGALPEVSYSGLGRIISMTVVTLLVSYLSWYVVESPFNRLKRYFPYNRPPTDSPARLSGL